MERYDEQEGNLIEQGEWHAAAELNADFWLVRGRRPELRARVIEMQERAFELQSESEAEEREPSRSTSARSRPARWSSVGELDKPDFHAIAERLEGEIDEAQSARVERAGHLPSTRASRRDRRACARLPGR